jgi:hypothetical protein
MDIVTWESAIADDHWRAWTPRPGSYQGWHVLLFSAVDGVHVRYYIFDDSGNLLGTSVVHSTANDGTGSVYPDHLMNLSISNWIGSRHSSNEVRSSSFKVDWVYYGRDVEMTLQRVQSLVSQFRGQDVLRKNSLSLVPAVLCSFAINNDAPFTTNRMVTLNNTASRGPTDYMASEDPGFSGSVWQPYSASPGFQLSASYGLKTVYLKVRNLAGTSAVLTDQIDYVTDTPPDPIDDLTIMLESDGSTLLLNWTAIPFATQYKIYAGDSPGFTPSPTNLLGTTSVTSFSDPTSLASHEQRFYVVIVER